MIVEKSKVVLPLPGYKSETGGTIFFQLDSSHVSAHLYYESKQLAVDVFGCGTNDIEFVAKLIIEDLNELMPDMTVTYKHSFDRFHHT
jgi:S-adenosylmethionine/arginine decarboxylase-like enzyme